MWRTLLKSKIHRARVTQAELDYPGSITIDETLLEAADIVPYERVEIYNITNGERLATYAIAGPAGSGTICINGAAAHRVRPGDRVIIASYGQYDERACKTHKAVVVLVDEQNRILPAPVAEGASP